MTRKPMATRKREPNQLAEALGAVLCAVAAIGSLVSIAVILTWVAGGAA